MPSIRVDFAYAKFILVEALAECFLPDLRHQRWRMVSDLYMLAQVDDATTSLRTQKGSVKAEEVSPTNAPEISTCESEKNASSTVS